MIQHQFSPVQPTSQSKESTLDPQDAGSSTPQKMTAYIFAIQKKNTNKTLIFATF